MRAAALPALLVVLALGGTWSCSSPHLDAVVAPDGGVPVGGKFTVEGARILDPAGREFVPKGACINGPNSGWSRDMTRDADYIASAWRFNLVRVDSRLVPASTSRGTNGAEALVAAFTSRRVVVLFSPRDEGIEYYTATSRPALGELVAWHKDLATRYRDNPYVWFEVMGSPGGCAVTPAWLTMHQSVVRAVRDEAGASNVIVAHGSAWGADDGCRGDDPPDPSRSSILRYGPELLLSGGRRVDNVIFSFSVLYPRTRARMQEYLDQVHGRGMAIFAGRYGGKFYRVDGQNYAPIDSGIDALFAAAVPRRIGRVVYHWYAGDVGPEHSNALTTGGNGSTGAWIDDPSGPTNLSWLGRIAWDDTHRPDSP